MQNTGNAIIAVEHMTMATQMSDIAERVGFKSIGQKEYSHKDLLAKGNRWVAQAGFILQLMKL